jgi:hypothetical protein
LLMLLLLLTAAPVSMARADGMFRQGSLELALMGGGGTAFDKSYFIIGGSAGYYLLDGLGVGLSYEHWSGDGSTITKYSPYAQYVMYQASTVKPYVGGFYRHTSVTGYPALESIGARAGVYIAETSNAYLGLGLVHESFLDCQQTIYADCSVTFFDLSFVFSF